MTRQPYTASTDFQDSQHHGAIAKFPEIPVNGIAIDDTDSTRQRDRAIVQAIEWGETSLSLMGIDSQRAIAEKVVPSSHPDPLPNAIGATISIGIFAVLVAHLILIGLILKRR